MCLCCNYGYYNVYIYKFTVFEYERSICISMSSRLNSFCTRIFACSTLILKNYNLFTSITHHFHKKS